MKDKEYWLNWAKAALIRAIKTFAEVMLGFLVSGATFGSIDWMNALSVSGVATLASILISVKGIPEVEPTEIKGE